MSCAVQRPDSAGETRAESTASTVARGEEAGGSKYIRTGLHSARCCGDVREQSLARGHSLQRRFHTCARETCSLLVISRNPGRGKHDARLLIDKHLSRLFHRPPAPRGVRNATAIKSLRARDVGESGHILVLLEFFSFPATVPCTDDKYTLRTDYHCA